jgi:ribosomal protein S3
MKRIRIKRHKRFLSFFKFFLLRNKFFFLKLNKIKGFKFDIRGKVGVTGNAKKRHVMFSFGRLSFSKKRTRLDYQQGLVFTNTGVLGVTMLLFY